MKSLQAKHIAILLAIISFNTVKAQTELKFNAATALFLVPNIGIETPISKDLSFQLDVLGSFWDSFDGEPLQIVQIFPEVRYYTKPDHTGFFAGGHVGFGMFTIHKFQFPGTYEYPDNKYQSGQNVYLGFTIGYKKRLKKNWACEIFIGAGHSEARYIGYDRDTRTRFDIEPEEVRDFNRSGEQIPYRGGIMLIYRMPYKNYN